MKANKWNEKDSGPMLAISEDGLVVERRYLEWNFGNNQEKFS